MKGFSRFRDQAGAVPTFGLWKGMSRAAALALIALGLVHCRPEHEAATAFPRAETLYLGGRLWGEATNFNPLTALAWPVEGFGLNLLYETLFAYNWLTQKMEPLLGESYVVGDDRVEVVMTAGAHWNDGKPLTGWDVKYTLDLGKKYKSLKFSPVWKYLRGVEVKEEAGGRTRVIFLLDQKQNNALPVLDVLQEYRIVPKHVIEPMLASAGGDVEEFSKLKFDHDPVASGPYRLFSSTSEKLVMLRDDDYWGNAVMHGGKMAAPKYIIHPVYKSNDHFSVALQQGRLDVSCTFMPRIWLKQSKGIRTWFDKEPFFVSLGIPMLYLNVTHKPLDDVRLRRAMAFAINYRDIRELAVSGYSKPLKPGIIAPYGPEAKFYSEEDAAKYGASYDPDKAKALLKEAGYVPKFGADGELIETRDARGDKLPTLYIKSPTGWSDYETIVRIAVKSMRQVGIDARERFIDAGLYWPARLTGDFDLLLDMPPAEPSPAKPWSRLDFLLTSKEWAPEGEKVYKNYGRFNRPSAPDYNPRFDALLGIIPTLKDETALIEAYRELNVLFMQYQPTLPVVYRPDQFYEVSVRHWTNFPTADNPYEPPQLPGDRLGTRVLWQIEPVRSN
jgi:peptide/nickel transport system substrate-binding protein